MINNDTLKGFVALLFSTTLFWSLNLNFGFKNINWLEIWGGITMLALMATLFLQRNKKDE